MDVVTCIGPRHLTLALRSIRSLAAFVKPRRYYLIASQAHAKDLHRLRDEGLDVCWIDEDSVIPGLSLEQLQRYMVSRGDAPKKKAGWYLQQFAKMAACHIEDIAPFYLVFDSDTVLLRPVDFFDED